MKLAIQHTLLPGTNLKEQFQHAADYGFGGVELATWGFEQPIAEYFEAIDEARRASGLPISSICTSSKDDLVHPDPGEREARVQGLVRALQLADALGAGGVIALPIRPPLHLPDLSPVANETGLITQVLLASLRAALDRTADGHAAIFLEPLNRYEAYYLRTIGHAAELCAAMDSPRVRVMADLFHMNIEEAHPGRALQAVSTYVGHVHLADSQRLEPGQGHLDFVSAFRSLRQANYDGWLALECRLSGKADEVLPLAVRFLNQAWEQAQYELTGK